MILRTIESCGKQSFKTFAAFGSETESNMMLYQHGMASWQWVMLKKTVSECESTGNRSPDVRCTMRGSAQLELSTISFFRARKHLVGDT